MASGARISIAPRGAASIGFGDKVFDRGGGRDFDSIEGGKICGFLGNLARPFAGQSPHQRQHRFKLRVAEAFADLDGAQRERLRDALARVRQPRLQRAERGSKRRQEGLRQAGLGVDRRETASAPVTEKAGDATSRRA